VCPALQHVSEVHMDTTFFDPSWVMPTQSDSAEMIVTLLRQEASGGRKVFLAVDMLGQERILQAVFDAFGSQVVLPMNKCNQSKMNRNALRVWQDWLSLPDTRDLVRRADRCSKCSICNPRTEDASSSCATCSSLSGATPSSTPARPARDSEEADANTQRSKRRKARADAGGIKTVYEAGGAGAAGLPSEMLSRASIGKNASSPASSGKKAPTDRPQLTAPCRGEGGKGCEGGVPGDELRGERGGRRALPRRGEDGAGGGGWGVDVSQDGEVEGEGRRRKKKRKRKGGLRGTSATAGRWRECEINTHVRAHTLTHTRARAHTHTNNTHTHTRTHHDHP